MREISGECSSLMGTIIWNKTAIIMPKADNLAILIPVNKSECLRMVERVSNQERELGRQLTPAEVVNIAREVVDVTATS